MNEPGKSKEPKASLSSKTLFPKPAYIPNEGTSTQIYIRKYVGSAVAAVSQAPMINCSSSGGGGLSTEQPENISITEVQDIEPSVEQEPLEVERILLNHEKPMSDPNAMIRVEAADEAFKSSLYYMLFGGGGTLVGELPSRDEKSPVQEIQPEDISDCGNEPQVHIFLVEGTLVYDQKDLDAILCDAKKKKAAEGNNKVNKKLGSKTGIKNDLGGQETFEEEESKTSEYIRKYAGDYSIMKKQLVIQKKNAQKMKLTDKAEPNLIVDVSIDVATSDRTIERKESKQSISVEEIPLQVTASEPLESPKDSKLNHSKSFEFYESRGSKSLQILTADNETLKLLKSKSLNSMRSETSVTETSTQSYIRKYLGSAAVAVSQAPMVNSSSNIVASHNTSKIDTLDTESNLHEDMNSSTDSARVTERVNIADNECKSKRFLIEKPRVEELSMYNVIFGGGGKVKFMEEDSD